MKLFERCAILKDTNYLTLIPVRIVGEEVGQDGMIIILFPKFINRFAKKYFVPMLKTPFIKLKLDELGSVAWLMIDGKKTVGEIAEELAQKFNDTQDSFEERLIKFLSLLYNQKMIKFDFTGSEVQ